LAGEGHRAIGVLGQAAGAGEDGADGTVLHREGSAVVDRKIARGASDIAVHQREVGQGIVIRVHVKRATGNR